jgi:disulfide oxidoreductase YuzD
MVRELNKDAKLKVLFLDRAESLDDETFEEFRKQIEGDEFCYFLTMVYGGKVKENGDPEITDIIPEGALWVKDGTLGEVAR